MSSEAQPDKKENETNHNRQGYPQAPIALRLFLNNFSQLFVPILNIIMRHLHILSDFHNFFSLTNCYLRSCLRDRVDVSH